ncbi:MAG TPA: guanylate kinase [Persephonella sp.]|uniref:Guanylate kinase n=1 Tax=Persephonella marina (strain DSM 14350 / EX-H1) TaxID=123214 RepID=C0QR93_PERMH|nr:guanylate kinase [Persephonella marina EX-H1]HCB68936.1 guanylate kinase [Persephonella sp.]
MRGEVYVLSSPAGGGKTTLSNLLLKEIPNLKKIVTCTTRKPRPGEKNGIDYIFLTKEQFEEKIKKGEFLEYAVVHGNYYGTPKDQVFSQIDNGNDVLLVIDVQGMRQIKSNMDNVITIFMIPPSIDELVNRMRRRGDSDQEIQRRLQTAMKEFPAWKEYDYIVINDILLEAKEAVKHIILSNRYKTSRFDLNKILDSRLRELMKDG